METMKYRYASKRQQLFRINRFLMIGYLVYYACVVLVALLGVVTGIHTARILILSIVLSLVLYGIDLVVLLRNNQSKKLKYIAFITAQVMLFFSTFMFDNYCMRCLAAVPIVACLFYYDSKFVTQVALFTIVFNYVLSVLQGPVMHRLSGMELTNDFMASSCIMILMVLCIVVEKMGIDFSDDAYGKAKHEAKLQKEIMEDVVAVATQVGQQTRDAMNVVNTLAESSSSVTTAMKDITASTINTAENIENQTVMTKSISEAIANTLNASEEMVKLADASEKQNQRSLQIMNQLKEQSVMIKDTNAEVADTMTELQNKAEEVKGIADSIFDISNKTNLLALNASIESARAGEAGRGFAVVADEIRQLAEKTRSETENIAEILDVLSNDASNAGEAVLRSVELTGEQDELIGQASESFDALGSNVTKLTESISEMDDMVNELSQANDQIVENISILSATTQEVTASSTEAENRSQENEQSTEHAIEMLNNVLDVAEELNQYVATEE